MAKSFNLYVADHFEALQNGKIAAMGMFTDRVVVLRVPADLPPPSRKKPYGAPLALLLNFAPTGPSERRGTLKVLAPGQREPVMQTDVTADPVQPGSSVNMIVHMQPLLVPAPGRFQVKLTMGDETMTAHFEVRVAPLQAQSTNPPEAQPAKAVSAKKLRRRASSAA